MKSYRSQSVECTSREMTLDVFMSRCITSFIAAVVIYTVVTTVYNMFN
jgi:hypothetical protein